MFMVNIDFDNIEIVFVYKIDKELKKLVWLFGLMNKYWLVGLGLKLGIVVIKLYLLFVEVLVKRMIFD